MNACRVDLSRAAALSALFLAVAGLTACGGNAEDADGAGPTESIAALPEPPAVETAADTTTVADIRESAQAVTAPPLAAYNCNLTNYQAAVMARINQYRAAGANCRTRGTFAKTTPLTWNVQLLQAAAGHSKDMATKNYFSHTSQDGRTFVQRIDATGYKWSNIGENIAAGYATVNAVVDGWMASDGHCANIMAPAFKDVGVACYAGGSYGKYWTMDLAKPR